MGKSLIIKGADFSAVAVPEYEINWYIDQFDAGVRTQVAAVTAARFVPKAFANVQGKTINAIKLQIARPGIITICVASALDSSAVFTQERALDFSDAMADEIVTKTFEPIIVPSNGYICVTKNTDTGAFLYVYSGAAAENRFWYYVGSNYTESTGCLCINFGNAALL